MDLKGIDIEDLPELSLGEGSHIFNILALPQVFSFI
jgi:hypothetical protein